MTASQGQVKREILLLRHGQVETSWKSICYGCMDVPLSNLGAENSMAIAAKIAQCWSPHVVYHSGLARTMAVASEVAKIQRLTNVIEDYRLRERNYGDWQGRTWDDVYASDPDHFHDLIEQPDSYRPPSGETTSEIQARIVSWFDSLESLDCTCSRVLAISHSGPITALIGHLLKLHARDWGPWMMKELQGVLLVHVERDSEVSITRWTADVW